MKAGQLSAAIVIAVAGLVSLAGGAAEGPRRPSVGLALSGGGAKGIAHAGVIQALEENGIAIDYVTGTSMGAIIGGLYASGYSPDDMMAMLTSRDFGYWSSGRINPDYVYLYEQPAPTPAFFKVNLGARDTSVMSSLLPSSLINPLPMSFGFMELFAPYTAQCGGNFDRLFVPYRSVTSDVFSKRAVVMKSGSLGDAVRASMSFPLIFRPIDIDSVPMFDGGIYDNFPFDVLERDFDPDFIIGVDVTTPSDVAPAQTSIVDQIETMVMQPDTARFPDDKGIKIHVKLSQFSLLDWGKAQEIYDIGYHRAMEMMDSIKKRVPARVSADSVAARRARFKAATPEIVFDTVEVSGGTPSQDRYVRYLFTHNRPDTFGMRSARLSYYRAISSGMIDNMVPQAHYDRADGLSRLSVKTDIKQRFNVGLGGFLTSSTGSFLYVSGGYNTLSFNSVGVSLEGWAGQSYLAARAAGTMHLPTPVPSELTAEVVASRKRFNESEKLFFEDDNPTFVTTSEVFAMLTYRRPAGRRGVLKASAGYGHLTDRYRAFAAADEGANGPHRSISDLGRVAVEWHRSTLDNSSYPTAGSDYRVNVAGMLGSHKMKPGGDRHDEKLIEAEVATRNYFGLGRHLAIGVESDVVVSTRKLFDSYYASVVSAPAFRPWASCYDSFNPAFSANSWGAVGVVPIWKISSVLQLRGDFYGFMPYRRIVNNGADRRPSEGRRFSDAYFMGKVAGVATFSFATLSVYGTYTSYPARNWHCGISFGVFMQAPRFKR